MKQYKSLDFAKFICAILIIILHTEPLSTYSSLATFGLRNVVTIIAVPFFFFTSGFLAFKKIGTLSEDKKNPYMVQYLKRVAIMYCIWSVVYLPFVVIKWVREGFSVFSVIEYIRDFFFEGSYSTIWFCRHCLRLYFSLICCIKSSLIAPFLSLHVSFIYLLLVEALILVLLHRFR